MITVHHLEQSRSFRVIWALEEAGLDYQIKHHARDPETRLAPKSARQLHPMGNFPMMEHDGRVLAESGAILEYIADQVMDRNLRPESGTALVQYRYWLHAAEGSLMPFLVSKYMWQRMIVKTPFFIRPVARLLAAKADAAYLGPGLQAMMGQVEACLSQSPWFAGKEFSFADIQMAYPLAAVASRMDLSDRMPHLTSFLERIGERPAFRKARDVGGELIPAR